MWRRPAWVLAAAALAPFVGACGGGTSSRSSVSVPTVPLRADQRAVPIGRGAAYRLPAVSAAVRRRGSIAGLRCSRVHPAFYGVHVELYAHRLVVPVPAGIGIAPPQRRSGVYVLGGACTFPIRTFEPTGVTVLDYGRTYTLRQLFAVWGQPLSGHALASFRGRVLAFVGGRRWHGSPGAIPLRRHEEVVLEVDGALPPHPAYAFPAGL